MSGTRRRAPAKRPRAIVALGASAGGLESLGRVLAGLPANFPAPVLVALHLDPHHLSQAVPLLQRRSKLRVRSARSGTPVQPGSVYLATPDHHLEVRRGRIRVTHAARISYSRPSIDVLFSSVARDYGPSACVAVLSGTGSDGSAGVAAVKARGGLAVAEDASTASFAGMPEAAGRTGLLDAVLPVGLIPPFLSRAVAHRVTVADEQWRRTLQLLERRSGARFSRYRSSTLFRRLQQRLVARGCRTMAAYLRLLEQEPAEVDRLQTAFLIKVSCFWRDAASWRALAVDLQRQPPAAQEVRGWSAGCATGEEAYTLALLLAHVLGTDDGARWKVFATDLDEQALDAARRGVYDAARMAGISVADRKAYFERHGASWRVGKMLRSRVVFGKHDLLRDPPLSGIDLLACRNVLIYFTPQERQRALARLGFAVRPGGILFLGRSEALRPLAGFARVGHSTYFRKMPLGDEVPRPRPKANDDSRRPAASRTGAPRRSARLPVRRDGDGDDERFLAQEDLNQELQSRNEELETVNEELQSLNDELSTMEEQMRGLGEESRRANDFLRVILDASPQAVVACDAANRVLFWNKGAVKRFRLSEAQAVGGLLFDLVPALDRKPIRAAANKVRGPGRPARASVRYDGVDYTFDRLPTAGKKTTGFLLWATDEASAAR